MPSKRQEKIIIGQGQLHYYSDTPIIANIIHEELGVSVDEVSEAQATGLINITGMAYEMGMIAGIGLGERHGQFLNKVVTMN